MRSSFAVAASGPSAEGVCEIDDLVKRAIRALVAENQARPR